jgi:hypothetical protein
MRRSTGVGQRHSRSALASGVHIVKLSAVTDERRFDSDTHRRFTEVTIHVGDNRRDNVVVTSVLPATRLFVQRIAKDGCSGPGAVEASTIPPAVTGVLTA